MSFILYRFGPTLRTERNRSKEKARRDQNAAKTLEGNYQTENQENSGKLQRWLKRTPAKYHSLFASHLRAEQALEARSILDDESGTLNLQQLSFLEVAKQPCNGLAR